MAVTIKQVAEASGFSVPTVSQVLNDKGHLYRLETRERVLATAQQLGYRPNSYRWALRTGKFNSLGLLLSSPTGPGSMYPNTWRGVAEQAAACDMHLTIGHIQGEILADAEKTPKLLREWCADGLLINYLSQCPPEILQQIERHHIPAIWLNSKLDHDCIYTEDLAAIRGATEHLIQLGHQRIGYVCHQYSSHYSVADRKAGYLQAMAKAGLESLILTGEPQMTPPRRREAFRRWLLAPHRPTALIACAMNDAMTALYVAEQIGLEVPRQLSLIATHDGELDLAGVAMARVRMPSVELGRQAVKMLLQKIANPKRRLAPRTLAMPLEAGETCAPPDRD